jgi:hypothetical protein
MEGRRMLRNSQIIILGICIAVATILWHGFTLAEVNSAPEAQKQQPVPQAQGNVGKEEPVDLSIDSIRLVNDLYVGIPAEIDVAVVNEVSAPASDVSVIFASEDGATDKQVITVGSCGRERVKLKWTPKTQGRQKIIVSVVCKNDTDPQNNQQTESVEVRKGAFVDLKISDIKVPAELYVDRLANIEAVAVNDADIQIQEANVILNADDGFKDLKRILLRPKSSELVVFSWVPRNPGKQNISVSVECKEDAYLNNNELKVPVEVMASEKPAETKVKEEKKE